MKKKMIGVIAVSIVALSAITMAYAMCGMCGGGSGGLKGSAQAESGVVNATCPVLGNKISSDTPYSAEYQGKKIGFCCAACIDTFNADPETYMKKVEKELQAESEGGGK